MRTSLPANLRPLCLLFGCVLAVAASPNASLAQEPASPPSTVNPTSSLLQAAQRYGLNQPNTRPWRLKASFQLLDAQGNPTDTGTFELLWISQLQYKQIYSSRSFTQTQYGVPGQVLFTGNPGMVPQAAFWLRNLFSSPMVSQIVISRSQVQVRGAAPGTPPITGPGCYDLRAARQPANWVPLATYCFDDRGNLTTFTVGFPRIGDATYTRPLDFDGHLLPGDVLMQQNGVPVLRAHLESVRWFTDADRSEMQPPPDAAPWHPKTPVVGRTTSSAPPASAH